jgi:ankyrin repeat protein
VGSGFANAIAVIDLLGDCKKKRIGAPAPQHVFARVAAMTGESITLLGGTLRKAQTWDAPRTGEAIAFQNTVARVWQEDLEKKLLAQQGRFDDYENKADQSYTSKLENSFLSCVRQGHTHAVRELLSQDPSLIRTAWIGGYSPLIYASSLGHVETVGELLSHGAAIDAKDCIGATALHHACDKGHIAAAKRLVRAGAEVNALTNTNATPLLAACKLENRELAAFLLRRKALIDTPNANGYTPLIFASGNNRPEVVKLLLRKGANANAADSDGNTALHHACERGYAEVASLLLTSDTVDKDTKNNSGFTPLFLAVQTDNDELITTIVNSGADLNLPDPNNYALLHHACAQGNNNLATLLLMTNRADINIKTPEGDTPLALACAQGRSNFVADLVNNGARMNLADNNGRTPLMRAAMAASPKTIEELLRVKAHRNLQDQDGFTALMHACSVPSPSTVSALLQGGASTSLKDVEGNTASKLVKAQLAADPNGRRTRKFNKILELLGAAANG